MFLSHLFEFLHLKIESREKLIRSKNEIESISKIEIKNIGFSYSEENANVLNDISLSISQGEILAIVGENGSGKSTMVKLLCGFHEPTSGEIFIDGQAMRSIETNSYCNQVSALFQDYSKYHLAAGFNVCSKEANWDEELLYQSTNKAGATEIINKLPENFNTKLGKEFKGSTELSIGQYQRMALSRALYKSASLLILDEPTSYIDGVSEKLFLDQLKEVAKDKIVIIISHKLSNIILADKICVLHHGQKVEYGTHDELIKKNNFYTKMFESQLV